MRLSQKNIKPFFCVDVTLDKNNLDVNGSEFVTSVLSKQKIEEYNHKRETLSQTIEKSQFPFWLQIVKLLSGSFCAIVLISTIKVGFKTAWGNAPILDISAIFCGILWVVLQIASKKKEKVVLKEEDVDYQLEKINQDLVLMYNELGVPSDTIEIDILAFKYKLKNGEIRPYTHALQTTPYFNVVVKIYADDEQLHIVDIESVYSIKKTEIKSIITVNKRISVPTWNKDEEPRKRKYKQYKMTVDSYGNVFFKPYYILEIEKDNQTFGIYFPCYELSTIENLTGLTASASPNE